MAVCRYVASLTFLFPVMNRATSGMAIRMAQDLGIHRSADTWERNGKSIYTDAQKRLRRRLWYSCIKMDRYAISATYCRMLTKYVRPPGICQCTWVRIADLLALDIWLIGVQVARLQSLSWILTPTLLIST